jgi:alkanesulfonate monooxygenase
VPIRLHWYLPTNGDSRDIVGSGDRSQTQLSAVADGFRAPDIEYLATVARAADQLGFEAVLTPTGTWCEDAWIVTAALSQVTDRLKFLVAFRPGLISPTLAAHQAATFQRISRGRLLLNVVTGGDSVEQRRFGDHLGHDARYERTEEFIAVLRGVMDPDTDAVFDLPGRHYAIEGARIDLGGWPRPGVFFGGASPAAERVAARQADVYLAWGETPEQIAERLDRMRGLAAEEGRTLEFGIRLHVIGRDTADAAWAEADRLLARLTPERIAAAQAQLAASESVGQQRMLALHRGGKLEVAPNLWAGYALVRGGAGTALVGSHDEVADRIEEYHALGIDHFILSGQPHLEEAYWFAEGAGAELRARGLVEPPRARAVTEPGRA